MFYQFDTRKVVTVPANARTRVLGWRIGGKKKVCTPMIILLLHGFKQM